MTHNTVDPIDYLHGMRKACEILHAWRDLIVSDDDAVSRDAVADHIAAIRNEGTDAVTAAMIGLTTIGVLALDALGFDEALNFVMLRAEIDCRPDEYRRGVDHSMNGMIRWLSDDSAPESDES